MEKGTVEKQAVAFLQSSLDAAINGLHALGENPAFWNEAIDEYATIRDKLIVESMLLVLLVDRLHRRSDQVQQQLKQICQICRPLVYTPRNRMLVSRYPHTAITFGISHFALAKMGLGDADFGHAIDAAFRTKQVQSVERLPYRNMEVRWLQSLLFADERVCFDDLLPASILNAHAQPLRMSTSDTYAYTHALMYLSDFGDRQLPHSLNLDQLSRLNDKLIAAQIVNENLDILGELLMATIFLGKPWSARAQFGWHVLAETWSQFGVLPSPSFEVKEYTKLSSSDARAYAFKHTYHTIYVGAILCSLILRYPERLRDQEHDLEDQSAMPLDEMLRRLDGCPSLGGVSSCQWTKVFQGARIEPSTLSALLCDGLAVHAVQQYDLLTLCGLLESQTSIGYESSETLRQVEAFLKEQGHSGGLPTEVCERIFAVVDQRCKAESQVELCD